MTASAGLTEPDWDALRAEFGACGHLTYLDTARKAILPRHAASTLVRWTADIDETGGARAFSFDLVEQHRQAVGLTYGAAPETIAFVKNTSEGINIAAHGYDRLGAGDNVIITSEEHENNALPWRRLAGHGIEVRVVPADPSGRVTVDALRDAIDRRSRVLAVSWVTYGRGIRLDMPLIGQLAEDNDLLLVVDAIQAVGVLATRLDDLGAHVVAAGGHKAMFGLNGTGILRVRDDWIERITPPYGAKYSFTSNDRTQPHPVFASDARRYEYGNPNFAGLAVLGASAGFVGKIGLAAIERRVEALTGAFIEAAEGQGLCLRTPRAWQERAGILSFATPPGRAASCLAALRERGIVMSEKDGHLRASVHFFNTEDEVAMVAAALGEIGLVAA